MCAAVHGADSSAGYGRFIDFVVHFVRISPVDALFDIFLCQYFCTVPFAAVMIENILSAG